MTFTSLSIDSILKEYESIRLSNKRLLQDREETIYEKIPRIAVIDHEIKMSYLNAAKLRVTGKDTTREISEQTKANNRKLTAEKEALLVKNGYPENYLRPIFNCENCQDTGYIAGVRCSCLSKKIITALYRQSNLENTLSKENFNTFSLDYYSKEVANGQKYSPYEVAASNLKKAKSFTENFSKTSSNRGNILIYGESGLGKTFLTNCIAKELLDNGHSVLYLSANELFNSLGDYLMNQKSGLEELYKCIYNSELLIIDDLGNELTNNFVTSQLFEIVNQRQIAGLSTLISTNHNMKELQTRYSEKIMSRIIADYAVYSFYGDNIRIQKRQTKTN